LPSAPTTGHGWCLYALMIMLASSKHGGSHWMRGAGATGACLLAYMGDVQVSAHQRQAQQGMGFERGARAIYKHIARWRKHKYKYTAPAPPPGSLPLVQLLIQLAGCSGCAQVQCTTVCRLQAHRLQQQATAKIKCAGPSNGATPCTTFSHCSLNGHKREIRGYKM